MIETFSRSTARHTCAALLAATILLIPGFAFGGSYDDEDSGRDDRSRDCRLTLIGLTADRTLVRLKECDTRYARRVRAITGLTGTDTMLVGIDYRVQDKKLYGVGDNGGIYVLDPETGVATKSRQLSIALQGTSLGVGRYRYVAV